MPRHRRTATADKCQPSRPRRGGPEGGRTTAQSGNATACSDMATTAPTASAGPARRSRGGRGPVRCGSACGTLLYGPVNRATARLPAVLTCLPGHGPDEDSLHNSRTELADLRMMFLKGPGIERHADSAVWSISRAACRAMPPVRCRHSVTWLDGLR